jgi:two-component system response regulator CpxR
MKTHRLLIVDDSVNLALLYKQELEDAEYYVNITNSFTKAIDLHNEKHYDLIIVETMLEDIKEYDTWQTKINNNGKIPFIINTTSAHLVNEIPLLSVNADACIMKSFDVTVLKEKVDFLLSDSS